MSGKENVVTGPAADPVARIRAYQTGDNGLVDIRWVRVAVTAGFIAKLRELAKLAKEHNLSEARVRIGPDAWCPEEVAEEARLENEELVVTADAFWFVTDVKHDSDHCESEFLSIDRFLAQVADGQISFGDIDDDESEGDGDD